MNRTRRDLEAWGIKNGRPIAAEAIGRWLDVLSPEDQAKATDGTTDFGIMAIFPYVRKMIDEIRR
jgi:hypothetical protein